jgi:FAD dependent oxidoreductase
MGTAPSSLLSPLRFLRNIYLSFSALFSEISATNKTFNALLSRISSSPGIPVPNPTEPFWLADPPFPELCDVRTPTGVPERAHVVVIGSGITGAAVARTVLREGEKGGLWGEGEGKRVVMLEARSVCSGATGRNGGHVKVSPWEMVRALKLRGIGGEGARKIVEFQRRHLGILLGLCRADGIEGAELREVETVDVFVDAEGWKETKGCVEELGREKRLQDVDWGLRIWEGEDAREVGCLCFLKLYEIELICRSRSFTQAIM